MEFTYILLGIIQGLTEFLPVSSSAHLVILERVFGITENQVAISVILHLGTALSLVVFFFRDLLNLFRHPKLILFLAITTVITGVIGFLGKDFFESLFFTIVPVAMALFVTGAILISTRKFMAGVRSEMALKDAVVLGFTQAIAIIPGISRSGITVSTLLFRGVEKMQSFRFAFLAAIPIIFAAAILEAKDINAAIQLDALSLGAGFGVSFITGLISLVALRRMMQKARLHYFGYYCIIVAILTLLFVR